LDLQTCNSTGSATFSDITVLDYSSLAPDIISCQAKGKIVTMSLRGVSGSVGVQPGAQATTFAQTIDMFLSEILFHPSFRKRSFGRVSVLEAHVCLSFISTVDLDIEGGSSAFYDVFVNSIRSLAVGPLSNKFFPSNKKTAVAMFLDTT